MASLEEIKMVLKKAREKEKMAEDNCALILENLRVNGFYNQVEKIKNDEARHQEMVDELLKFLK